MSFGHILVTVLAYENGEEKLVATMLTTLMLMPNRPDLAG